jgi:hypothetical protein
MIIINNLVVSRVGQYLAISGTIPLGGPCVAPYHRFTTFVSFSLTFFNHKHHKKVHSKHGS